MIGNATISLGGGNDQIVILGNALNSLTSLNLETGAGDDRISFSEIDTNAPITISNSAGNDVRRIQHSELGNLILNGAGSSAVEVSDVRGNLTVNSNGFSNTAVTGSTVSGTTNINGSGVNDAFVAANSIFGGALTALGSGGNDLVALLGSHFNGAVVFNGNAGHDTLGLRDANVFDAGAEFDGGSGNDNTASDGTSPTPRLIRTEFTNHSTLEGLIDLALSEFDDLLLGL